MASIDDLIARLGTNNKAGSSKTPGTAYHDIPGRCVPHHRGSSRLRAERIMELVDLRGKTVLDLGCSVGSISAMLAERAGRVVGYDYDDAAIAVAQELYNSNTFFECRDLTLEFLDTLPHYDVVIWLSQFMWMVQQHGLNYASDFLWRLSRKCEVLIFESAGERDGDAPTPFLQEQILGYLTQNTCFRRIRDCGPVNDGWTPRNLFLCDEPLEKHVGQWATTELPARQVVRKTFEDNAFARELFEREAMFLQRFSAYPYFPKITRVADRAIEMTYEGQRAAWIPAENLIAILAILADHGIVHRDIRPENLLWNGRNVVLIDFAFAVEEGEITNYHYNLGGKYKCPYGFNDEYSLRKVQRELEATA